MFSKLRCILSVSYIKPQHRKIYYSLSLVVSYQFPTSNLNFRRRIIIMYRLYLISFLHQTSTISYSCPIAFLLYLISFLHQTSTVHLLQAIIPVLYLISFLHQTSTKEYRFRCSCSCILSVSYIKPQPLLVAHYSVKVVSYQFPTSNLNSLVLPNGRVELYLISFLHQTSTLAY